MRFRKLRIAWSVVWGTAAILLAVLWVRSYWWDDLFYKVRSPGVISFRVDYGKLEGFYTTSNVTIPGDWQHQKVYLRHQSDTLPSFMLPGFKIGLRSIKVPGWLPAIFLTVLAAAPWLRWRFTLRTLLIATTLVAIVLGLIVWAAK